MTVRRAQQADLNELVKIWHDGWHDAHARIVPEAMARARTPANFRRRVADALSTMWVVGEVGAPLGFYVIRDDELYQFYVAEQARGRGVAASLIQDAETRLAANGNDTAWLACAIGNERAARFYEKQGWRRSGNIIIDVHLPTGATPLEVWRYEEQLRR